MDLSYLDYMAGQALTALLINKDKAIVKYHGWEKDICNDAYRIAMYMVNARP